MVSIIKNQLLKHLSRYTKNLSSDKINLSTFRGEGELTNLQLDEKVLTELLELPSWLRLTSAWCNQVSFRISWTKLKSVPITLTLDEVNITVETCENARTDSLSSPNLPQFSVTQGKYSFIHKVIDGITVIVNTVNVRFISPAFIASVQMSRIRVESKTPKWLNGDLRVTRLKISQGILLIFKELSWQTVRIEASSTQDTSLTPLRLLTNHARCRITIKKKLSDCSILSSRLVVILDDLLWVLTDSQLKAALHFVDSLSGLIKAATQESQKTKAQKKLETLPEYQSQIAQQSRQSTITQTPSSQKIFSNFDVRETSYHFFSQRIDLHLCDDDDGRSCYPDLTKGGALQISVQAFQIDYYPYHLANSNRIHWPKYKEASIPPALWLEQSLNSFRESVLNLCHPNRPQLHAQLERKTPKTSNLNINSLNSPTNSLKEQVTRETLAKLMSACIILRMEDFTLYRVTTSGRKQIPKEFISGDKDRYSFPAELPVLHAEFTFFYYPGDFIFPLPPSKIFIYANPVKIQFDISSILWFNSFAVNLHESLLRTSVVNTTSADTLKCNDESNLLYMDVKFEAIMPRVIIESRIDIPMQKDRPKIMEIQISRFALTNIREMGSSRADLAEAVHSLQEGSLIFGSCFPSVEGDLCLITERLLSHIAANDANYSPSNTCSANFSRYAMWTEPRDIWCIKLDPVWIDFIGAKSLGQNKSLPFIDAVPITFWINTKGITTLENHTDYNINNEIFSKKLLPNVNTLDFANSNSMNSSFSSQQSIDNSSKTTQEDHTADIHVIAHISNLVSVQIDHYQYLFLLRLTEELNELTTFLSLDTNRILENQNASKSFVFGCVIPQVEVTFVMPSQTPGKESSGGDAESVIPDSASLGDDLQINSTNTSWPTANSLDQLKNANIFGNEEISGSISNESLSRNPNTHGHNVQIQNTPMSQSPKMYQDTRQDSQSNLLANKENKQRVSLTNTGFSKDLNSGLLSMKKGFSSFMTSFDTALKTGADDVSDTISMYSDVSSDSENYAVIMGDDKTVDCMDIMFRLNPLSVDNTVKVSPIEVASEVCEEPKTNMSSPSEPSDTCCWRRRDLVSMATFRLTTVEIIRQNQDYTSSLRLQVSAISCDECSAIPWDELQTAQRSAKAKFEARCRAWNVAPYNPEDQPCLKLRIEEQLKPPKLISKILDKKIIKSWFSNQGFINVKNLALNLSMSTVVGLTDLTEDEIISKSLPLDILLENVSINLIEDRPPVNITSPGPVPINLVIGKMKIIRDENGLINIQPNEIYNDKDIINKKNPLSLQERDKELFALKIVMQQLKLDNENLKKEVNKHKENGKQTSKMKLEQENIELRNEILSLQNNIILLQEQSKELEANRRFNSKS